MKRRVVGVVCGVMGCVMGLWELGCQQQPPQQSQWQTLFDGSDVKAWRGINMATFPEAGWVIEDGSLVRDPSKGSSRDIITRDQYGDFELALEFKLTEAANSGIKYLVVESLSRGGGGWRQVSDSGRPAASGCSGRAGRQSPLASLYDILPAQTTSPSAHRPVEYCAGVVADRCT